MLKRLSTVNEIKVTECQKIGKTTLAYSNLKKKLKNFRCKLWQINLSSRLNIGTDALQATCTIGFPIKIEYHCYLVLLGQLLTNKQEKFHVTSKSRYPKADESTNKARKKSKKKVERLFPVFYSQHLQLISANPNTEETLRKATTPP